MYKTSSFEHIPLGHDVSSMTLLQFLCLRHARHRAAAKSMRSSTVYRRIASSRLHDEASSARATRIVIKISEFPSIFRVPGEGVN